MDAIPFVKVTLEEAKASLRNDVAPHDPPKPPAKDWTSSRGPHPEEAQDLATRTFRWLAELPANKRPNALLHQYPRIANRLAEIWKRPLQCERYLDDLMLDMRGNRRGFPPNVATEIAALKLYLFSTSVTVHFDVWGSRIGVD
jgi:hypothetical protein